MLSHRSRVRVSVTCRWTVLDFLRRHLAGPVVTRSMSASVEPSTREHGEYERAVQVLNGLQTNAAVLEQIRRLGDRQYGAMEVARVQHYMDRIRLEPQKLDQLQAIHITGTKGKGSVGVMCESILRAHGLRTGFYISPHLLEVRERIRLDGHPISKSLFVKYFWDVYNKLDKTRDMFSSSLGPREQHSGNMPSYFRFLTVMAFNLFLQEKVDVAIVEVGIGGTYDSTNVIPSPVVSVITSLGFDHMDILGSSLPEIAWQKGGICKAGRPVLTLPQRRDAMDVIRQRAAELKASSLQVAPPLSSYPGRPPSKLPLIYPFPPSLPPSSLPPSLPPPPPPELGVAGDHQLLNCSLAVQVCRCWLGERGGYGHSRGHVTPSQQQLEGVGVEVPVAEPFALPEEFHRGLEGCRWPGRCEVVNRGPLTCYLDGAHTPQSVEACVRWFQEASSIEARAIGGDVEKLLLFNTTGRRDARVMLTPLLECGFSCAMFCPNTVHSGTKNTADQTLVSVSGRKQLERCVENQSAWRELCGWREGGDQETKVFHCISSALAWAGHPPPSTRPHPPKHTQVLVTGSLHLVGAVLGALGFTVDTLYPPHKH